ncbi:hypothetical protein [Streptomyces sp. NBC_01198]|uniref:hypothetical protein n=1 Tax=Streptomyces sp. NBC_01198 TaxID=2903769 RepID=UPI002E117160|nr:hypothetical protein OG702_19425 [Streptomyces sp. NBC_01198]
MNHPPTLPAQLRCLAEASENLSHRPPLSYSAPGPDIQHLSDSLTELSALLPW